MKNNRTRMLLLSLAIVAGCVPSWNPFYTEKDLVFEPALVATWRPVETKEGSKENWTFTRAADKRYLLEQTDEDGRKASFDVRLFKLNGRLLLDLYVTKIDEGDMKMNAWASFSLVPAHLLLKVEQLEPGLKIAVMNPDWLQKFLKGKPDAVAHRIVGDESVILSASTSELQKFVLAHIDDKDFFGGAMEMKRK